MTIKDGMELRNARIKRRWSQLMLADELDISRPYITRMENGLKPLNQRALEFIKSIGARHDLYLGIGSEKTVKKDTKTVLKINKLTSPGCPKTVQLDEVSDFSDIESINGWEKWWWKTHHALCVKCSSECKQSNRVEIIACSQFGEEL